MMHYIYLVIIGLVVGFIARALHPGKDSISMLMTAVLGIAGSFAATFLGQAIGLYKEGQNAGFIMSVIGAVVLLVVYGFIAKKKEGSDGGGTST